MSGSIDELEGEGYYVSSQLVINLAFAPSKWDTSVCYALDTLECVYFSINKCPI
jgi:hypothetical protein